MFEPIIVPFIGKKIITYLFYGWEMRTYLFSDMSGTLKYCSRGQKIITNMVQLREELRVRRVTFQVGEKNMQN